MSARAKFWLISLSAALAVTGTLALGRWQLGRAAHKEALQRSLFEKSAMPKLDGQTLAARTDPLAELHRQVGLRGRWIAQHTVFLDNRQMNGKQGLYVVTPLQIEGSAAVILVQRGWVARNFMDRGQVAGIQTPSGVVEVQGRVAPPPAKLYEFGGAEHGRVRQNIDLASLRLETGLPLLPISVQQAGAASEGLLRDWPLAGAGVQTHYGYAFQWFALSALITILYVWFQLVRRYTHRRRA